MPKDNTPPMDVLHSLTGSFLISTSKMPDPRFEEQVIYVCAHSDEGAMGIVINKPNFIVTMDDVLRGAGLQAPSEKLPPVYIGGPVEQESAFILYTSDYRTEHELVVSETVSVVQRNEGA